jgi:drug/metabolite transporter (DMT)-like permease
VAIAIFDAFLPVNKWKVLYMGLVTGIGGHLLMLASIPHLDSLTVSIFFNLEPLFGMLIGMAYGLQGMPGWLVWIGGTISIASLALVSSTKLKTEKRDELLAPNPSVSVQMEKIKV